jgi:hypothetical protein
MNTIVVCSKCVWIGYISELYNLGASADNNPVVKALIEANHLVCKCCPRCKSTNLFYREDIIYNINTHKEVFGKNSTDNGLIETQPSEQLEQQIIQDPQPVTSEDEIDFELANTLMDSAETVDETEQNVEFAERMALQDGMERLDENPRPVLSDQQGELEAELQSEKPKTKKVIKRRKPVRPSPMYKPTCDTCDEKFSTKIQGATRCPECLESSMRKVGS